MFTRQNYQWLAEFIRFDLRENEEIEKRIVTKLAIRLGQSNSKFKPHLFLKHAGFDESEIKEFERNI